MKRVIFTAGLLFANMAMASEFEAPRTHAPSELLADRATGANYQVADPVHSDGFLRIYALETPYGQYRVEGDFFLAMRLKELAAISALESAEDTETFQTSLKQALKGPVDLVGDAIDDPGATVERTVSGVGRLFGRAASAVRNRGKSNENVAESLLGISRAKREIAVGLGVDPYTDFAPLADRLEKAAQVSAAGSLTVKGLFALIPGTAGLAVSTASAADGFQDLLRDRTATELREINRAKLVRAVGEAPVIDLFLDNPKYTPADQTVVADALFKLRSVKNVGGFLTRMTNVSERSLAVFMRERARLLASYHEQQAALAEIVVLDGFPLSLTGDGTLVGMYPIDDLAWTERTAGIVSLITDGTARDFPDVDKAFLVTGEASPLARDNMEALGWDLAEGVNGDRRNGD